MKVAGVALAGGRLLWVHSNHPVAPLDRVILALPEGEVEGTVVVSPDQLLRSPAQIAGVVLRIFPRQTNEPVCAELPGAALPPLGARVSSGTVTGLVTALDPVGRMVTVTPDEGDEPVQLPAGLVSLDSSV